MEISHTDYAHGEDDGEVVGARRVGEVRCVVLVEWYRPLLISKAQQKRAAAEQQLSLDFQEDAEE